MVRKNPTGQYIRAAIFALLFSLCLVIIILFGVSDALTNLETYYLDRIEEERLYLYLLGAAGVLMSIAVATLVYTRLSMKPRIEMAVWDATSWLALQREQFRRVYEAAPIPYVMLGDSAEIHEPNKAALRFFGVSAEELEKVDLFSLVKDKERALPAELREKYHRSIPIDRQEIQMETKDHGLRWVSLSIFDMRNPASRERTGLAVLFDITEQKELDRAKTEFVSLASHQLRTPIATTKWLTDMLLSGDIGDMSKKQKEYVEKVYVANESMIELVDTLLNVSRAEIGTLPTEEKDTNVQTLCDSVLAEMAPQITEKKLNLTKQYGQALTSIQSDPKLLRIVIHNLVSNAVKYTKEGGSITITLTPSSIAVEDSGVGIPKNQQERVFSKLFRADNVLTLPEQGTGLGLYLVKSIVERLNGSMSFVSKENEGSTFTIHLRT